MGRQARRCTGRQGAQGSHTHLLTRLRLRKGCHPRRSEPHTAWGSCAPDGPAYAAPLRPGPVWLHCVACMHARVHACMLACGQQGASRRVLLRQCLCIFQSTMQVSAIACECVCVCMRACACCA